VSPLSQRKGRILSDLRRRSEELEDRSDDLERRSEELGHKTDEVRQDWERKRADPGVPGAVPEDREGPGGDSPEARERGKRSKDQDRAEPEDQDRGA
jgi:hypothetical protein